MGKIRVHLEDQVVVLLERPAKSSNVCSAEAHLTRPLEDVQPRLMLHDTFDEISGTVRRFVVDDENLESRVLLEDRSNQARDVLALVERRNYDEGSFSHPAKLTGALGRSQASDRHLPHFPDFSAAPSHDADDDENGTGKKGEQRDQLTALVGRIVEME